MKPFYLLWVPAALWLTGCSHEPRRATVEEAYPAPIPQAASTEPEVERSPVPIYSEAPMGEYELPFAPKLHRTRNPKYIHRRAKRHRPRPSKQHGRGR